MFALRALELDVPAEPTTGSGALPRLKDFSGLGCDDRSAGPVDHVHAVVHPSLAGYRVYAPAEGT